MESHSTRKLVVAYGVWILLAIAVLTWELLGVKKIAAALGIKPDHLSISAMVWKLPLPVRLLVDAALVDACVHFAARTPLIPGVG